MSRLNGKAEGRERNAPADRRAAETALALAARIERLLESRYEDLNCGEYDDLREHATRLWAYGNLLSAPKASSFLGYEIGCAERFFSRIERRIRGAS